MAKKFLPGLLASALLLITISPAMAAPQAAPTAYEVIAAVNALRASHGMDPYLVDPILMLAAQMQADYLASTPNFGDGHVGPGGTDADARAHSLGYPEVPGLDINENWGSLPEGVPIETLIFGGWGDAQHMHTMLHDRGQHVGAGVSFSGRQYYVVLDVAAFWGDAGLTAQPTSVAYGQTAGEQLFISQYIAPVVQATPAADGSITHIVMSGQSLWMLSHHYAVDIERLRQLNPFVYEDVIFIGQKILIRPASPATATVEATATIPTQPPAQQPAERAADPAEPGETAAAQATLPAPAAATPAPRDDSGWFLLFFGLFGAGVILVVISQSGRH